MVYKEVPRRHKPLFPASIASELFPTPSPPLSLGRKLELEIETQCAVVESARVEDGCKIQERERTSQSSAWFPPRHYP